MSTGFIQKTFRRHLSIEPFCICAVIRNHVVISDPLQLTHLSIIQFVVHGRSPPVRIGIGGTLTNTNSSIPIASPWPKLCELSYESCIGPIDLDSSSHLQLPSCHRPKCWHKLSFLAHWDKLSPCSGSSGKHELEHYQCTTWKCI